MKVNVSRTKTMVIGTKAKRANIQVGNGKIRNCQALKYLGTRISDAIKWIAFAKEAFNEKKRLLCGKIRKILVESFIQSIASYGSVLDHYERKMRGYC